MVMVTKTTGGKDRHPKPNNPEDSDEEGAHTYLDYGRCDGEGVSRVEEDDGEEATILTATLPRMVCSNRGGGLQRKER